jgi:tRNA dimethylallyltransferase
MPSIKHNLLVLVGPTSSGKSDLAVKLAKRLNGEIISADSRQVYRGMDIGTGKITTKEMRGIRHHLLDVADPKKQFTAERYRVLARQAIIEIQKRGKLAIICGGTGFYIDAILNDSPFPSVPPDPTLRKKLSKKSVPQLLAMLKKLDLNRWRMINGNDSDKKNARRLIRAIEIARGSMRQAMGTDPRIKERRASAIGPVETGEIETTSQKYATPLPACNYDAEFIGIKIPTDELRRRIRARLLKRIRAGMVAEVKHLHKPRNARNPNGGLSWKRLEELGLEYRYVARHLQGKLTKQEMIDKLTIEIGRYAKRQMTWFKRNKAIEWLDSAACRGLAKKLRVC